ncbi:type I restriction endonuclease subunit R [Streptomyces sp. ME19-01-6]|uniref:type I restriction endonuclease subunit R n=1 Tax=Streptomyces sp. ME19-01-6 TaxID=3028686 RepID=UPI0029AAF961|nr:type I restriction endonuclease [Streptomyces sp. ME19-01-6]MDX3231074.1 type I restriction endonuclease [Streptomyces sp. ME19-01-6]
MATARREAERDEVERPFIDQLVSMGWTHVHGPDLASESRSYDEVFLTRRMDAALRRINRLADTRAPWVKDAQAARAIDDLRRAAKNIAGRPLLTANRETTDLLLHGTLVKGDEVHHRGTDQKVHYIDWDLESPDLLKRNEFVVVDQFRVRTSDGEEEVPDLVLFVNGIPVAVVECKSPDIKDPIGKAIGDLRAYSGNPLTDDGRKGKDKPRAIPELFAPAQLLIAACGETAVLGTISGDERHYAPWRSVTPHYRDDRELRRELEDRRTADGRRLLEPGAELTEQHKLIAVVLKPENLLNIIRHYVFELPLKVKEGEPAKTVKTVCRHQQFRAVEKIVHNLQTRRTRLDAGAEEKDERGGVIWHTQGSGKSLTMAFLARRLHMSPDPGLNRFTILVVTDRTQLQDQLSAAVRVSDSDIGVATSQADLEGRLERAGRDGGRSVIFAMIQKYLGSIPGLGDTKGDDRALTEDFERDRKRIAAGADPEEVADPKPDEATKKAARRIFRECSDSTQVLVLVDEAHRSHTSVLHACLRDALPNAARIGFTGTPIMKGSLKDTGRIFGLEPGGGFLDEYRMREAERDKVVVPIRYEGRTGPAGVRDKEELDERFEDLIAPLDDDAKQRVRNRWAPPTGRDVSESTPMIRAKARDMFHHYVLGAMGEGFKAQVAAVSRRAAVLYRDALRDVRAELLARVRNEFGPEVQEALRQKKSEEYTRDELLLLRAWHYQELLRRIDFVPVISAGDELKSGMWREWTDKKKQEDHVERFLEPFPNLPPDNPWEVVHGPEKYPVPEEAPVPAGGLNPWSGQTPPVTVPAEKPPIAFLIVKSMLLTGFDAPIEQVLYVDRPIQDAELLQAVARVNRPAPGKEEGLVVDYYGVLNNLAVTLAAYQGAPPTLGATRLSDGLPALEEAAYLVELFLEGVGVGDLSSRARVAEAMLTLNTKEQRAAFDRLLRKFMGALDGALPHEAALRQVPNAQAWTLLQKRVRRHYRDAPGGGFSVRGYGRKVRALIADHLELPEIEQAIAPVSILATDFDEIVDRIPDVRESAAEQVQALRYHLEERAQRDDRPVYRKLSEELEEVLREFDGRWDKIKEKVGPLIDRAREAEQPDSEVADLSPLEQRLFAKLGDCLADHPSFAVPDTDFLRTLTQEVYAEIVVLARLPRYAGGDSDANVSELQSHIWQRLRRAGLKPQEGGLTALRELSNSLAGFAQDHLEIFRAEGRAE